MIQRLLKVLSTVCAALFLGWYFFKPWEWGVMNDMFHVEVLRETIPIYGVFKGALYNIWYFLKLDWNDWGFFRYSQAVYAAIIYQFPPGIAYSFRMLMFFGILFAVATVGRRVVSDRRMTGWAALVAVAAVLSIRSIYDGAGIVFLSEFSGIFFIALALLVATAREVRRRNLWITICYLIAVGFKAPFLWLPLFYGVYLLFKERNFGLGAFLTIVSLGFLAMSVYLSQRGVYSQQIYKFSLAQCSASLFYFAKHAAAPGAVLAGLLFLSFRDGRLSLKPRNSTDWHAVVLAISGLVYLVSMLPRGVGKGLGYYFSPPIFMIVVAGVMYLLPRRSERLTSPRWLSSGYAFGVCMLAAMIGTFSLGQGLKRDASIRGVRDWALGLKSSAPHLAANSIELAISFQKLLTLRSAGAWNGTIVNLGVGDPLPGNVEYYIVFSDQANPNQAAMSGPVVAEFPLAKVYRVNR